MKKLFTFYLTFLFSFLIIYSLFFFTVHAHAQESGTIDSQPGDDDYIYPRGYFYNERMRGAPCNLGVADCRPDINAYYVCVNDSWVAVTGCPF